MTFVVTEPCIDVLDRSCIEECPVDCIYEGARMMYIHPDECIDCGACEPACPMDAIYHEEDVPENMAPYVETGRSFFADLGTPGGAATLGKQSYDTGPALVGTIWQSSLSRRSTVCRHWNPEVATAVTPISDADLLDTAKCDVPHLAVSSRR